ncbi:hypothetical protein [Leifsonia poae]|uniref:hypothetical protein n=1 Tax=Leifsonia poae TaxID=110933 RepID=UPI003D668648
MGERTEFTPFLSEDPGGLALVYTRLYQTDETSISMDFRPSLPELVDHMTLYRRRDRNGHFGGCAIAYISNAARDLDGITLSSETIKRRCGAGEAVDDLPSSQVPNSELGCLTIDGRDVIAQRN